MGLVCFLITYLHCSIYYQIFVLALTSQRASDITAISAALASYFHPAPRSSVMELAALRPQSAARRSFSERQIGGAVGPAGFLFFPFFLTCKRV